MKIKRILLSNNDEDRYFSERQDELKNLSTSFDKVCIEIIKIIELYDIEYGQNINHWMTTLCSFFNNVSKSEKRIFNTNRLQLSFIKAIENSGTVSRILGDDFLRHCSSGFGKEYVRNLWEEILNMTQREEKSM